MHSRVRPKISTSSFSPRQKNGVALFRALQEFGAPLRDLTAGDFIEKGTFFTMGVPPIAIDILSEIAGVKFAQAWKNRSTEIVDPESGLTAHFISRADLIAGKLAAGRPQDLADVDALRRAQAALERQAKRKRKPRQKT